MGMEGMSGMAEGMAGMSGMEEMGKAMAGMGMEGMAESLASAFEDPSVGITTAMSGTVGMISGAISGKAPKEKSAISSRNRNKRFFQLLECQSLDLRQLKCQKMYQSQE